MKIYTKTGDKGQTQIYADEMVRLSKSDNVLACYGTLDELNAHIGLLLSKDIPEQLTASRDVIAKSQPLLFQIGFAISASSTLTQSDVGDIERTIDELQAHLPAQTHFILPGGHPIAAQAHVCRTVTRRAERCMVALIDEHPVPEDCLKYLNRLSDLFFTFARAVNHVLDFPETTV